MDNNMSLMVYNGQNCDNLFGLINNSEARTTCSLVPAETGGEQPQVIDQAGIMSGRDMMSEEDDISFLCLVREY